MRNYVTTKSFYEWCTENNRYDILNRWDYERNDTTPEKVPYKSNKSYYFKCPKGIHQSELFIIINITNLNSSMMCRQCNSFEFWCIENGLRWILDLWDYSLNKKSPAEISYGSGKSMYFKCPLGIHKSEKKDIHNITKTKNIYCKQCNSFAQWGIDNFGDDFLLKYWDFNKNKVDPWEIAHMYNGFIWIYCQEIIYHGSYSIICSSFIKGIRCSYCACRSIHPLDSLGAKHKECIDVWSDKNKKSPFEYAEYSSSIVWWKCANNRHDDYQRSIHLSTAAEFKCPHCTRERNESYLSEKVFTYIISNYNYKLNHEHNCSLVPINPLTKHRLPYDCEVAELKLLIEIHGSQHYQLNSFHKLSAIRNKTTPEYEFHKQKLHDRYKKYVAFCKGYFYLEIPYWTEQDESYKALIDNKINSIQNN